jgi:hypothetical protein
MWMEESRRESRLPTRTRPSSRARRGRNVSPRSWVRNVSQYLIRSGPDPPVLFSMNDFCHGGIENEASFGIASFHALDLEHLFDAVHQVLGLNGLAM